MSHFILILIPKASQSIWQNSHINDEMIRMLRIFNNHIFNFNLWKTLYSNQYQYHSSSESSVPRPANLSSNYIHQLTLMRDVPSTWDRSDFLLLVRSADPADRRRDRRTDRHYKGALGLLASNK